MKPIKPDPQGIWVAPWVKFFCRCKFVIGWKLKHVIVMFGSHEKMAATRPLNLFACKAKSFPRSSAPVRVVAFKAALEKFYIISG